mgnify:CR=1 FL=1
MKICKGVQHETAWNEKENIAETIFMKEFIKLYPRDIKYYLGKNFEFDENVSKYIADKKCAEANHELQHILYEFDSLEKKIKNIKNET